MKANIKELKLKLNLNDPFQNKLYEFVKTNSTNTSAFLKSVLSQYVNQQSAPVIVQHKEIAPIVKRIEVEPLVFDEVEIDLDAIDCIS